MKEEARQMRSFGSRALLAFCPVVLLCALSARAEFSAEAVDPLEWLYPDSLVQACTNAPFREVDVPLNGVAEVQFLFNGLDTSRPLAIGCDAPIGGEWFRLVDVPVEKNTDLVDFAKHNSEPNPYVTRTAPFRVYDAMEPIHGASVMPKSATMALRFQLREFPVGKEAFDIAFSFSQGGAARAFRVRVNVSQVALPSVGANSFKYTNWINLEKIAKRYGLKPWSEAHFAMIAKYARLAARGRQNTMPIDLGCVFDVAADKSVRLREDRLERLVDIYTGAGIHWIEGGHLARFRNGSWRADHFELSLTHEKATAPEGVKTIASIARQLDAVVTCNGWKGRWLQHIADEPHSPNDKDYRILAGIARRHFPGYVIIDAVETPLLAGAVDIWCPKPTKFYANRQLFEFARRQSGDSIWIYTCCDPGGKWLNRLLDGELVKPLFIPWACAVDGIDGYLHWGLNQWSDSRDPFNYSCFGPAGDGTLILPAGDTHIVYPGPDGPWSSVRFEAMRQGMEDYEIIARARVRDDSGTDALLKKCVRSFNDWTADVPLYRRTRRALLKTASRMP